HHQDHEVTNLGQRVRANGHVRVWRREAVLVAGALEASSKACFHALQDTADRSHRHPAHEKRPVVCGWVGAQPCTPAGATGWARWRTTRPSIEEQRGTTATADRPTRPTSPACSAASLHSAWAGDCSTWGAARGC